MKLLYCRTCDDIFNLTTDYRECTCKTSRGNYLKDGITAEVYTLNRHTALLLGFANYSFERAMADQLVHRDLPADMPYGGKIVSPGRNFKAFVIPESAPSVIWHYSK